MRITLHRLIHFVATILSIKGFEVLIKGVEPSNPIFMEVETEQRVTWFIPTLLQPDIKNPGSFLTVLSNTPDKTDEHMGSQLVTINNQGDISPFFGDRTTSGYREGVGTQALFTNIVSLLQFDDGSIIVVDQIAPYQSCLRLIPNRIASAQSEKYAGECSKIDEFDHHIRNQTSSVNDVTFGRIYGAAFHHQGVVSSNFWLLEYVFDESIQGGRFIQLTVDTEKGTVSEYTSFPEKELWSNSETQTAVFPYGFSANGESTFFRDKKGRVFYQQLGSEQIECVMGDCQEDGSSVAVDSMVALTEDTLLTVTHRSGLFHSFSLSERRYFLFDNWSPADYLLIGQSDQRFDMVLPFSLEVIQEHGFYLFQKSYTACDVNFSSAQQTLVDVDKGVTSYQCAEGYEPSGLMIARCELSADNITSNWKGDWPATKCAQKGLINDQVSDLVIGVSVGVTSSASIIILLVIICCCRYRRTRQQTTDVEIKDTDLKEHTRSVPSYYETVNEDEMLPDEEYGTITEEEMLTDIELQLQKEDGYIKPVGDKLVYSYATIFDPVPTIPTPNYGSPDICLKKDKATPKHPGCRLSSENDYADSPKQGYTYSPC